MTYITSKYHQLVQSQESLFEPFIPGQKLLMKKHPSQRFKHHWFPLQGAMNNDIKATSLHLVALAEYISLKNTTEGSQNSVSALFRSALNSLF